MKKQKQKLLTFPLVQNTDGQTDRQTETLSLGPIRDPKPTPPGNHEAFN